jgi:hypothetical protein
MNPTDKLSELKAKADTQKFQQESYALWGKMQDAAKGQGWYPTVKDPNTNVVTFITDYDAPFNTVFIPGEKDHGHVEILGKPDKTFDVVVKTAGGKLTNRIYQNASPETVQGWITSQSNTVAKRAESLPPDQRTIVAKQ